MGALLALLDQLGEIGYILLHLESVDGHELASQENFA